MVHNIEKYELATHYRKRGFSYSEIAKICGVSKGTVSNWLAKKAFSKKVRNENVSKAARENVKRIALVNKARQKERKRQYSDAERTAETEFKHYKHSPLFIAGLMAYLSHGDQTNSPRIRLTTNKPPVHKMFIAFATEFLGVERTTVKHWLLLSEGTQAAQAVSSWSVKIALPKSQFGKTQFISSNKKAPLHNGTGNTIIASTLLKHKLSRWLELLQKEVYK